MIQRQEIVWLGVASGVMGALVGGLMLYAGLALALHGVPAGYGLCLPAAPAGGLIGWLLARRLAKQL